MKCNVQSEKMNWGTKSEWTSEHCEHNGLLDTWQQREREQKEDNTGPTHRVQDHVSGRLLASSSLILLFIPLHISKLIQFPTQYKQKSPMNPKSISFNANIAFC